MGVDAGLIGPLRGPISCSMLGEAGALRGLQPASGLRPCLRAGEGVEAGAGLLGPLWWAICGPPAGANVSGERTTHRQRWRFPRGWGGGLLGAGHRWGLLGHVS